jgi:hypothetical protein
MELQKIALWKGKPIDTLSIEELRDALEQMANMYSSLLKERSGMWKYVDYSSYLMRDKV